MGNQEFQCQKCNTTFTYHMMFANEFEALGVKCPHCQSRHVIKIVNPSPVT